MMINELKDMTANTTIYKQEHIIQFIYYFNTLMRLNIILVFLLATFSLGLRLRNKARWSTYDLKIVYEDIHPKTFKYSMKGSTLEKGEITGVDITGVPLNSNECACMYTNERYCLCMQGNGNLVIHKGAWPRLHVAFSPQYYRYRIVTGACWSWTDSSSYKFTSNRAGIMITKAGWKCWEESLSWSSGRLLLGEDALYWNFTALKVDLFEEGTYAYLKEVCKYQFQPQAFNVHHFIFLLSL
eukprot:TRINITY_DN90379_c0_g1_i1.p1 TRINITY_DN90379_c0_g1~~TRINITY_DN90379_c0_g1_i1.p1  ORF type:complete len:275 (+),score=-10.34 TRINITY_DN90379_c0_g1_i1:104-826(+)